MNMIRNLRGVLAAALVLACLPLAAAAQSISYSPNTLPLAGTCPISTVCLDLSGAWSGTGTLTGLRYNVTADPGPSNAASLLADLQYLGASKWKVDRGGNVTAAGNITAGGGTFSGALAATNGTVNFGSNALASQVVLTMNAAAGQSRGFAWSTGGSLRWSQYVAGAESGSNAGSNLSIDAFDDTGAYLRTPLSINRSTGNASFSGLVTASGGVSATGAVTATGSVTAGASNSFGWSGLSKMLSPSDGVIWLSNAAGTGFSRLQLGGTTASSPSLKASGTTVAARLADDSADAPISAAAGTFSGRLTYLQAATPALVSSANIINNTNVALRIGGADATQTGTEGLGIKINSITNRGGAFLGTYDSGGNKDGPVFTTWLGSDGTSYAEVFTMDQAKINSLIPFSSKGRVGVGRTQAGSAAVHVWGGGIRFDFLAAPSAAPSVSLVGSAGNLSNGVYNYKVSYVTLNGEGPLSANSAQTVVDNTTAGQVSLTNIGVSTEGLVIARRVYRTLAGGNTYFLLTTLNDNTTTSFVDNVSDATLSGNAQASNIDTSAGAIQANGVTMFQFNNAGTMIGLGGLSASVPAFKRSGTTLQVRLADDSAAAPVSLGALTSAVGTITASTPAFTATQTWNNSGVTFVGDFRQYTDSASASGSQLANWQVGGTTMFLVRKDGFLSAGQSIQTGGSFLHQTKGSITFQTDGVWTLFNNAGTGFGRLQFGGTSGSFASIKANGAALAVRAADDTADANLSAAKVTASAGVKLPVAHAASLPTCSSSADEGLEYGVDDATSATFHAAIAGGGSNHVKGYCTGTGGWVVGG